MFFFVPYSQKENERDRETEGDTERETRTLFIETYSIK